MSHVDKNKAEEFWSWFIHKELELVGEKSADDPIFDVLLAKLQEVHPEFFFEIGTNFEPYELIITAEGKENLFPVVDEFVLTAPSIPSWKIISLKSPKGFDFVTNYEGVEYDPKSFWFLPLIKGEGVNSLLGLRIGIPGFSSDRATEAKFIVLVILDTCLGERSAAEDIRHVEVTELPSNAADVGYMEFTDLPEYIQWRKRKIGAV